ncbi:MAG: uracil-DNA glycosylase [Bacteroidia bacterium]|nr:uracil-DNA glycosylase [Bacteroidia bacterium]
MSNQVQIAESWKEKLLPEFTKPYFEQLKNFLKQEKANGKCIFPPGNLIFSAFDMTPFYAVKVVLLGQDPYHGIGQAHGLCFSVNTDVAVPPSLKNIYKEIANDIPDFKIPSHGNLTHWAKQGVLLLNATLTVEKDKAGSHQGKGWEQFTDAVITTISTQKQNVVFILWGKFAQSKSHLIDPSKHLILTAAHPSPFSVHNGFFGCKHFSKTNDYLISKHHTPIQW